MEDIKENIFKLAEQLMNEIHKLANDKKSTARDKKIACNYSCPIRCLMIDIQSTGELDKSENLWLRKDETGSIRVRVMAQFEGYIAAITVDEPQIYMHWMNGGLPFIETVEDFELKFIRM